MVGAWKILDTAVIYPDRTAEPRLKKLTSCEKKYDLDTLSETVRLPVRSNRQSQGYQEYDRGLYANLKTAQYVIVNEAGLPYTRLAAGGDQISIGERGSASIT